MEQVLYFHDYNEALKRNNLLGLKCKECGTITCPPKMVCEACTSTNLETAKLSGIGIIKTFTTTYVAAEGKEAEAPYTIVMVELAEGPWIAGNLIDIDPTHATMSLIGKKVKLGSKVFPGDRYSGGMAARPLFSFLQK